MIQYYEGGDYAVFDGLVFRRDKGTGYYLNAKTHKRLHVYVWEHYNGKIPKGYHIHHKDFDKTNNEPSNLVLLGARDHGVLHGESWSKERYERQLKILRESAIPKASKWHGSDEGKEWHKEHYEKTKDALYEKKPFVCEYCGKRFESVDHGNNRFCSNKCRSNYRRKSGVDNEIRVCEWCGNEFTTNKYSKAKTCSRSCRNFLRWDKSNQKDRGCRCLQHGSCG